MFFDGLYFDFSFVSFYIKFEWYIRFFEIGCNLYIVYNFFCIEIVRIKNYNKICLGF